MITDCYSIKIKTDNIDLAWKLCSDILNWNNWDFNISYARKISTSEYIIKHRKFIRCRTKIIKEVYPKTFDHEVKLPLSRFRRKYFLQIDKGELNMQLTHEFDGFLDFFWAFVVGRKLNSYAKEDLAILSERILNV